MISVTVQSEKPLLQAKIAGLRCFLCLFDNIFPFFGSPILKKTPKKRGIFWTEQLLISVTVQPMG
jgi:hypothetical protein